MLVVTDDESFEGFGSVSPWVTVAVLVGVPAAVAVVVTLIVALAPRASPPRAQLTVGDANEHVPWLGTAETYVTFAIGSGSETFTFVAGSGPLFFTTSV